MFEVAEEAIRIHRAAFSRDAVLANALEAGGEYAWRVRGLRRARATRIRRRRRARSRAPHSRLNAARWTRIASSATSNTPMPPTFDVVPEKYFSISARERPTASKICAPVYDM